MTPPVITVRSQSVPPDVPMNPTPSHPTPKPYRFPGSLGLRFYTLLFTQNLNNVCARVLLIFSSSAPSWSWQIVSIFCREGWRCKVEKHPRELGKVDAKTRQLKSFNNSCNVLIGKEACSKK